ncbi:MAG: hypothetical protein ACOY3D_00940 [Candidatus Omnitrophota bacterium]
MRPLIIFSVLISVLLLTSQAARADAAKEHFDRAVKYYLNHDLDASLAQLRECLAIDANYPSASKLLPIVLKKKDEALLSKELPVAKADTVLAEEYYRRASEKYLNNDLYGAAEEANKALAAFPGHEAASELLETITRRIRQEVQTETDSPTLSSLLPPDKRQQRIRIYFKGEDINVAMRTLAQLLGINVIFTDEATGKLNASFSDAPAQEVLASILKSCGLTYFIDGNVVRIVKIDEDKYLTRIFTLRHTTLTDSQLDKIKEIISDRGRILYDAKSRTLVISDNYSKIHDIEAMVERIDAARPQIYIEAKVMEVVASKVKDLGIKWDENFYLKASGAKRPIVFPFPAGQARDDNIFGKMYPLSKPAESGEVGDFPVDSGTAFKYATADDFTFGSIETGSMTWTLKYLEDDKDTVLLSNPRLVAIDDEESEILVGTTIPIPTYERNATTGQMEVTGYTDQEVGIVLRVTPKIHKDGYVTLTVHPEVSEITGYTGPNNERPIISSRQVTTTLRVKDGDTVVIGGMLKDKDILNVTKLPWLGDIPFFGYAFKYKSKSREKTEVLVFLTVNIPPASHAMVMK